jgi:hypothetical protein
MQYYANLIHGLRILLRVLNTCLAREKLNESSGFAS